MSNFKKQNSALTGVNDRPDNAGSYLILKNTLKDITYEGHNMLGGTFELNHCNLNAWYSENMILAVWDKLISTLQLSYIVFDDQTQSLQTRPTILAPDTLALTAPAGLLVREASHLYVNHEQCSVSICGSYACQQEQVSPDIYLLHLQTALEQIIVWNRLVPGQPITEHCVIFPYLINATPAHWALGVLKLSLNGNILQNAKVVVYNSLPSCGGRCLSKVAAEHLQALLRTVFATPAFVLENHPNTTSIIQQQDGNGCGPITVENGKFFLANVMPLISQLTQIYQKGAGGLRLAHLHEINRNDFYLAQLHNQAYQISSYVKPLNYGEIVHWFRTATSQLTTEDKKNLRDIIRQHSADSEDHVLVLAVRDFIKAHEQTFEHGGGNNTHYLDLLFIRGEVDWDFNGDHVDTLALLARDLEPQQQAMPSTQTSTTSVVAGKETVSIEKIMEHDLAVLFEIDTVIATIITPISGEMNLMISLRQLGVLNEQITWCEIANDCVRNKHGYRNRAKTGGNKINDKGAKIYFETIAHLKDLSHDTEYQWLLIQDVSLLINGLQQLRRQIHQVFEEEKKYLSETQQQLFETILKSAVAQQNTEYNFIVIVCSYYHDLRCLSRIHRMLMRLQSPEFESLNLKNIVDRYQFGYLAIQLGETAKEVSDFVKPETRKKDAENNLTRFLFGKLGHYRQRIKDSPYIVSDKNIKAMVLLQLGLFDVLKNLLQMVTRLRQFLLTFCEGTEQENISNIISQYPKFNQPIKNHSYSDFELQFEVKIKEITRSLDAGTTKLNKRLQALPEQILRCRALLSKKHTELEDLAQPVTQTAQTVQTDSNKYLVELYKTIFLTKQANAICHLVKRCPDHQLTVDGFSEDEILLIKAVRGLEVSTAELDKKELDRLKNTIKLYLKSVNNLIHRCVTYVTDPSYKLPELTDRGAWVRLAVQYESHRQDVVQDTKSKQIDLGKQIKNLEDDLAKLESNLHYLTIMSGRISPYIESLPDVGAQRAHSVQEPQVVIPPHERILLALVIESGFMHYLYSEIQSTHINNNLFYRAKLVMAAKLSFAFYGQYYKIMKTDHAGKIAPSLIGNSILATDCFEVMLLRHKKIAHNTHACDEAEFQEALTNKVVPWLKDFKSMVRLFLDERDHEPQEISNIVPADERLLADYTNYGEADKTLFLRYTGLVALNRLLRSREALASYQLIRADLQEGTDSELATEIYWQASFAYRNLGDFNSCVTVLLLALSRARQIKDKTARGFKVSGVHCDLGIAYTQIDDLDRAEQYLKSVTTSDLGAFDHQIIAANVMLGQIELTRGYELIGRTQLELVFVKYWPNILEISKPLAIGLLNQLAAFYLDNFELNSARDCLNLAETILRDHLTEFIIGTGQAAVYFKAMLLNNLARYKLLVALICDEPEQTRAQISTVYEDLSEAQNYQKALRYFDDKQQGCLLFTQTLILLEREPDRVREFASIHTSQSLSLIELFREIKSIVLAIKNEIKKFHTQSTVDDEGMLEDAGIPEHERKLNELTKRIINCYQNSAHLAFLSGNYQLAQDLIRKAIVSQYLVDYLEFEFEQIVIKRQDVRQWLETCTFDAIQIRHYLWRRLFEPRFTQRLFSIEESMIARYFEARQNKLAMSELIAENEMRLMSAYYQERGETPFQIKVDHDRNLLINRFFAPTATGELIIKERGYVLPQGQSDIQTPPTQPAPRPENSTSAPQPSAGFDAMFRGMFAGASTQRQASASLPAADEQRVPQTKNNNT